MSHYTNIVACIKYETIEEANEVAESIDGYTRVDESTNELILNGIYKVDIDNIIEDCVRYDVIEASINGMKGFVYRSEGVDDEFSSVMTRTEKRVVVDLESFGFDDESPEETVFRFVPADVSGLA